MYFIRAIIEHYNLYFLFIPLFIYYCYYIKELLYIIYCYKISPCLHVIYYPVETNMFFVNIFTIYPRRLAFNGFYNVKTFNPYSILALLFMFIVNIIFGLPFLIIRLVYLLFITKSTASTWYILSKYENKILLFENYNMLKNMKPYLRECALMRKNMIINALSNNFLTKCLIKTGNYTHACVKHNETHAGVYYTTSKQSNISLTSINQIAKSYSYGIFTHKKEVVCPYDKILNPGLLNLLDRWGVMDIIKYHDILSGGNTLLSDQCKNFLSKCGSTEQIKTALAFNNSLINFYTQATNLLDKLERADYSQRNYVLTQNIHTYNKLKEYAELCSTANNDAHYYDLLYKIDSLLK